MIVVLDYDETFTRCPKSWLAVSSLLRANGHHVIGCTMRTPAERHGMDARYFDACSTVHFSSRQGKREYLASLNILPSVWIDDTPEFICLDAADRLMIPSLKTTS